MKYDKHGIPMVRDPQTGKRVSALEVKKRSSPKSFNEVLRESKAIIRACDEADKKGRDRTLRITSKDLLAGSVGSARASKSRVPGLEDALALDRKLRKNGM